MVPKKVAGWMCKRVSRFLFTLDALSYDNKVDMAMGDFLKKQMDAEV